MALYIPQSILHLARSLYVRPETYGPTYVFILRFEEKEKRAAVVAKATVHKQGSVQRQFAGRLELSAGQWVI